MSRTHGATEPEVGFLALMNACEFAFQPIVNIVTGQCFGFEALLRGFEAGGYATQRALFDAAHAMGLLDETQARLWDLALARFVLSQNGKGTRIFLNLDARSLTAGEKLAKTINGLLAKYDIPESAVVFEISEMPPDEIEDLKALFKPLKRCNCKLAVDRYGAKTGPRLLYGAEPDFIKIDPLFIHNLAGDSRKKLLMSQMVAVAHLIGGVVIALGVETEAEFLSAKEVGCDLIQGFVVEAPSLDLGQLALSYRHVEKLARGDRRQKDSDQRIILDQMEPIEPLPVEAGVMAVFDRLCNHTRQTFVPIIDAMGQPLGIVREANIKNYAYAPFGKDLILNKGLGRKLKDFIVRCPVADIHVPVEDIMAIFSADEDAEGILLVDQMRYVGFLSARSIIRVMNEKSLAMARDQNPLTKLPGNALINQYVTESLAEPSVTHVYAYVDFDDFKPFNDKYGFRQGDRAILLFAALMRKQIGKAHFLGHIGGDDFFIGFKGLPLEEVASVVKALLADFRDDAQSFYDAEARQAGYITALDREGTLRQFPLLSASTALIDVNPAREGITVDDVSAMIAKLKKTAKRSPEKIAHARLG